MFSPVDRTIAALEPLNVGENPNVNLLGLAVVVPGGGERPTKTRHRKVNVNLPAPYGRAALHNGNGKPLRRAFVPLQLDFDSARLGSAVVDVQRGPFSSG